jgi:LPXTG-motif cell wall-anchored protein
MRRLRSILLATLLLGLVATAALAAGEENSWKITSPANGSNVTSSTVTVTVDPGQIKVVKPGPVVLGEGHWHFLVDGQEVGKGPTNTFEFKGLTPGKHLLEVQLHLGDHTPYPGATPQQVTVNVALPNTGTNLPLLVTAGGLMLVAGGALLLRRRGARA